MPVNEVTLNDMGKICRYLRLPYIFSSLGRYQAATKYVGHPYPNMGYNYSSMPYFQRWFRAWATNYIPLFYVAVLQASILVLIWLISVSGEVLYAHDVHIDGLVQVRRNSTANALELRLPCTSPSISYSHTDSSVRVCNKTCSRTILTQMNTPDMAS